MVSVIIPTFNREKTIEKSIRSVLAQTYSNFELIVVDDGSTDSTKAVIDEITDHRIRYYRQNNEGACSARNKGISLSKGDYIAFHDSDDIWRPEKLERQVKTAKVTGADILFCQMRRCNLEDGTVVIPELVESGFIEYCNLMVGISTQTLFMKRIVADSIKFDVDMPRFQDLEWLLRAVKNYSLYGMKDVLVDYYFSEDSIGTSKKKMLDGISLIYRKNPDIRNQVPKVYEVLRSFIMDEGISKLTRGEKDYSEYLKLGFSMSDRVWDRIKYYAVCTGIFGFGYSVRHSFDAKLRER